MMKALPVVLLVSLALACSSSDGGAANGVPAAEACAADCDRQVAAKCSKTPASYGSACKSFCSANRKGVKAECTAAFDAIYQCAGAKITYTCSETGFFQVNPSGGCASEAAACTSCNGGNPCNLSI